MEYPRKLDTLLGRGADRLVRQAKALLRLERLVLAYLEPQLAGHCRLAGVRDGALLLQLDSPAWASRLRHRSPALLSELKAHAEFETIARIRVIVRPAAASRDGPAASPAVPLSGRSAEAIAATADNVRDPALSAALRRLARHR